MIANKVANEIKQHETISKALTSLYNMEEIKSDIEEVINKMLELENLFIKYASEACRLTGIINEEWRSISGYKNYQVSNKGSVRNIKTERILKPGYRGNGYLFVKLSKNGICKPHNIHRLVANEFLENPLDLPNVDHINCDITNNCMPNLRFCSQSQNSMNRKKQENAVSRFKGVTFCKNKNLWRSRIIKDGHTINIGYFEHEVDAARAYNSKAIALFGEFKKLNDIPD